MTPWTAASQTSLSITNAGSLLKLMSIESVMPSNHLILCHPLLLLPSIFPSIRVFSKELALPIRKPKNWNCSNSPSNEYSGLTSFRIDWFDLLAVQGTLKSSLAPQFENINSLALSLLFGTALTSIHDYWKNHSFDYTSTQAGAPTETLPSVSRTGVPHLSVLAWRIPGTGKPGGLSSMGSHRVGHN